MCKSQINYSEHVEKTKIRKVAKRKLYLLISRPWKDIGEIVANVEVTDVALILKRKTKFIAVFE